MTLVGSSSAAVVTFDLGTIMALVLVTTTPLKSLLEVWVPPRARSHDALVQLLAMIVGVAWSLLVIWAQGGYTRSQELQIVVSVVLGMGGGVAGIGAFHVAKALQSPGSTPEDSTTTTTVTTTKTAGSALTPTASAPLAPPPPPPPPAEPPLSG